MAYLQYRCLVSHFNGKCYKKDLVYLFTSDPGANFVLEVNDERNAAGVDRDGTWYPGMIGYDDFKFPLSQSKTGSNLKPDYDETNNGYLFPQNDATEVLYMDDVTSHRYAIYRGMIWYPHIHYWQDEATIPVFQYRLKITAAGATVGNWTDWIPTVGTQEFTYASGTIHQIMGFPAFDAYALGCTSPASVVDLQLRRNDNVVTGDVLAKQFDIHVPLDAPLGSGQLYIK